MVTRNAYAREHGGESSREVLCTFHMNKHRSEVEYQNRHADADDQTEIRVEPL
jgi:hypothetical protein